MQADLEKARKIGSMPDSVIVDVGNGDISLTEGDENIENCGVNYRHLNGHGAQEAAHRGLAVACSVEEETATGMSKLAQVVDDSTRDKSFAIAGVTL